MKKTMKNLLLMGIVTLAAGMFTACSSSDDGGGGIPIDTTNPFVAMPDGMNNISLSGIVKDSKGKAVQGVKVRSGSASATTNAVGMFTLTQVQVSKNRVVVNFAKTGYFDLTRSCDTRKTLVNWEVSLIAKNEDGRSKTESFSSSAGKDIVIGNTKVELPADGFITESGKSDYTGNVNVDMAYISPDDKDFADAMPGGDLRAIRVGGDEAELLSYGMIAVSMTDDYGNQLNLKEGAKAKVSFPIPNELKGKTPETIPLWWFNDNTGKWEEDGEAKLVGDHYEGEVKHFSWWNLDYPSKQGTVSGYVRDKEGHAIGNVTVHVGQRTTKTNEYGYYAQTVPAGEDFTVLVRSEDYGDYGGEAIEYVKALEPYEVRTVDLTLSKLFKIKGRLMQGEAPLIGALVLTYGASTSPAWLSNYDGTFELFAPSKYTGAAKLTVTTGAGRKTLDITLKDADLDLGVINFESTPIGSNVITVNPSNPEIAPFTIPIPADLVAYVPDDKSEFSINWNTEDYNTPGWNMFFVSYIFTGGDTAGKGGFFECIYSDDTMMFDSDRNNGTVTIVKLEADKVTFTMNGRCNASKRSSEGEIWDDNAFYQSGEMTIARTNTPPNEDGRW